MKLITGNVEISDQYGKQETKIIGVFDDPILASKAIEEFEIKYKFKRIIIISIDCEINEFIEKG